MKITKQKEAILAAVLNMRNHPTAGEIYDKLRGVLKHISLGTVYRNLNLFAQIGKVRKISIPGSCERFDHRLERHDHLLCKKCDRVLDVDAEVEIKLRDPGAVMDDYTLFVHGVCSKCSGQWSL